MHYELFLPFPPTINNYYKKSKAGGRFISEKGRKFRSDVNEAVIQQLPGVFIDDRMLIEYVLFAPDNRKRDTADNYAKALLDALTCAELWEDDVLIDQCFSYRGEVRSRNGSTFVRITDAGPIISDVSMLPMD